MALSASTACSDAADEREPVGVAVATLPARGVVAAVDRDPGRERHVSVAAEGDEHVPLLASRGGRQRRRDLPLRLLSRAGVRVVPTGGGEGRVPFGAVDPVAVGVDEPEIGQIGRARADRRVLRCAVFGVRGAVAVSVGRRRRCRRRGRGVPVRLRSREQLRGGLVPRPVPDRLRGRTPVANRRRGPRVRLRALDEEHHERLPRRRPYRADPVADHREWIAAVPVGRVANPLRIHEPHAVGERIAVRVQHRRDHDPGRLPVRRSRRRDDDGRRDHDRQRNRPDMPHEARGYSPRIRRQSGLRPYPPARLSPAPVGSSR